MIRLVQNVLTGEIEEVDLTPEEIAAQGEPPVIPAATPPAMKACALRVVTSGEEISEIAGSFNIMTIMRVDVGTYWVFSLNEIDGSQPELVPNNGIHAAITEWSSSDFFIECKDHAGGTLIDPVSFGFSLYQF